MIPKQRTPQEEQEMADLMALASERDWTVAETERYYLLLGYDADLAAYFASNGPIDE